MAHVKQDAARQRVADVRGEIRRRLIDFGLSRHISKGKAIAITAGSRGMGGFVELLRGISDAVRECGGEPFIVPAMGSHGGADAGGQKLLLETIGASESAVGAPIRSTMETYALGRTKNGAEAHIDRIAADADGIIVLGRTIVHPESAEGIASGLLKMTTVGLGKQKGAQEAHSHGLWDSVRQIPSLTLAKSKVICGVSVVENAFREPAQIRVVDAKYEAFFDADKALLKEAKKLAAHLPFDSLDMLVVDRIGKDISGTGMDLNVIGKWRMEGGERRPNFHRIVALSLTKGSLGNALGIGLADFTTQRLAHEYDSYATYINLLTASEPGAMNTREGELPLALENDKGAMEVGLYSSLPSGPARICRIRSTAQLTDFWVSEPLLRDLHNRPGFSLLSDPQPMDFDENGNLNDLKD